MSSNATTNLTAEDHKDELNRWRPALDRSLEQLDDSNTILQDSKLLLGNQFFCGGNIDKHANLLVHTNSLDRIGVLQMLTKCCANNDVNITRCTSQRLISERPKLSGNRLPYFQEELHLCHSTFAISGHIDMLRKTWGEFSEIKDLPDYYLPRPKAFDEVELYALGADKSGVLNQLSTALYDLRINVSYLYSEALHEMDSSEASTMMTLELPKSRDWDLNDLKHELLKQSLLGDWDFKLRFNSLPEKALGEAIFAG